MSVEKNGKVVITQKDIDKIITPPHSREESMRLVEKYEAEYEKSKQHILEIMKRNMELYKNENSETKK